MTLDSQTKKKGALARIISPGVFRGRAALMYTHPEPGPPVRLFSLKLNKKRKKRGTSSRRGGPTTAAPVRPSVVRFFRSGAEDQEKPDREEDERGRLRVFVHRRAREALAGGEGVEGLRGLRLHRRGDGGEAGGTLRDL